jgi:tetratricopeptide (TPR) repeat protein
MKILAVLGAILVYGFCFSRTFTAVAAETNSDAAPAISAELTELRQKMGAIERSSREVAEKWDAVVQQNTTLSNVLTGLQQTLNSQKEKEIELSNQAHSFTLKVIAAAGVAIFMVFLLSYWFQLRALNRVMEISNILPAPRHAPALLDAGNAQTSSLLSALKVLETRIQQLEIPSQNDAMPSANGHSAEAAGSNPANSSNLLSSGSFEAAPSAPSSVALLVAKGQTLLDMDRLSDALACFQDAVMLDASNAEAHLKKGIALERLNRLEAALNAYEEAVQLNPKRAIAHASKARVLAALHRYDEAISVYDSALGKNGPKPSSPIFVS